MTRHETGGKSGDPILHPPTEPLIQGLLMQTAGWPSAFRRESTCLPGSQHPIGRPVFQTQTGQLASREGHWAVTLRDLLSHTTHQPGRAGLENFRSTAVSLHGRKECVTKTTRSRAAQKKDSLGESLTEGPGRPLPATVQWNPWPKQILPSHVGRGENHHPSVTSATSPGWGTMPERVQSWPGVKFPHSPAW